MCYIGHMYVTLECESLHFDLGRGGLMWSAKIRRTPYPRGAGDPCRKHGGGDVKSPSIRLSSSSAEALSIYKRTPAIISVKHSYFRLL